MAGMARIVLYRRERPVVVEPLDNGLLLTTLRYERTVRRPEDILGTIPAAEVDDDMVDLATDIIRRKQATFNPSAFEDRYETALLELIRAKQAGRAAPSQPAPPAPTNVVNLFDALRKSLAAERDGTAARKQGRAPTTGSTPATRQPRKRKSA
jgi:DNA end-binding protein Ku